MPAPHPTSAVLARTLDADARVVRLPLPPARLPTAPDGRDPQARRSQVLAFPSQTDRMAHPAAFGFVPPRFTTADRLALAAWQNGGASGYVRLLIEDGRPGTLPDCGAYALIYRPGTPWASWGLTRRPGAAPGIMAWRCSTGATLGLYDTMDEALRALPLAGRESAP